MNILAIDTAAELCAACVFDAQGGRETGRAVLEIGKGHAEHVMEVIADALEKAGIGYDGIGAIAVSIGPGSFTGVRVGVSAARGLALALGVPALGVTTLEALAFETRDRFPARPVLVATGNRAEALFAASWNGNGEEALAPTIMAAGALASLAMAGTVLAGNAARIVAEAAGGEELAIGPCAATADIAIYARIAIEREMTGERPVPLYLRPPDARPQSNFTLPMKTA